MRYAQRGGYTAAEQQRRGRLRLEAAGRFARGEAISEIAHDLRVTKGSVRRWHRAWRDGGPEALRSELLHLINGATISADQHGRGTPEGEDRAR